MGGLAKGARIAVETCLGVKPNESVLVVTDPERLKIAEALVDAARASGGEPTLMLMGARSRHGEEPPKLVAMAMRFADVVLAPTTYSLTHTQARVRACEAGARVATMPMITEDIMSRGAMIADYDEVRDLSIRFAKLLTEAEEVEVRTPAGTDLRMSIEGRIALVDTGILRNPGDFGNLPAGEAYIAPVEGTAEGRIVVDGSMMGAIGEPIEITMAGGRAIEISGELARKLRGMLDSAGPDAYNLAEFGIGTNRAARLIGNVLEDEKVLGTCHVALGENSTFGGKIRAGIHVDGILLRPTIRVDGRKIVLDCHPNPFIL